MLLVSGFFRKVILCSINPNFLHWAGGCLSFRLASADFNVCQASSGFVFGHLVFLEFCEVSVKRSTMLEVERSSGSAFLNQWLPIPIFTKKNVIVKWVSSGVEFPS